MLRLDEIQDLYFSRGLLERGAMVALAQRGSVPDLARTELEHFDVAAAKSDITQVVESDVKFHRALIESLESPRLSRLYASLMGEFHLCMAQVQIHRLLDPRMLAAEHGAIVTAIEAGDPNQAVMTIDAHLDNSRNRMVRLYQNETPLSGPAVSR